MNFKTGQTIELHTPAHAYVDAQLGWTDPGCIIPAKTEIYRITRVSHRGDDTRLTLRNDDNCGCGILVSKWLAHRNWNRTLRVLSN